MSILLVHPFGNENVRQALGALVEAEMLEAFVTAVGLPEGADISWLPEAVQDVLERRRFSGVPARKLRLSAGREIMRNLLIKSSRPHLRQIAAGQGRFSPAGVAEAVSARAVRCIRADRGYAIRGVYGYQSVAQGPFAEARDVGIERVLELPHVHWRTTQHWFDWVRSERPAWAPSLADYELTPQSKDAEDRELDLATRVLVPSAQVEESLELTAYSGDRMFAPYGVPAVEQGTTPLTWSGEGPLRILFVGRVMALKGIGDLVEAAGRLGKRVQVTTVGQLPTSSFPALEDMLATVDHRGTMSRSELMREYRRHHLLVMPSLTEGRSLSVLEALSAGLPCVVTAGTGVEDLVSQGAGRVIEKGDVLMLEETLAAYLEGPQLIEAQSHRALQIARANGWERFRRSVSEICSRTA